MRRILTTLILVCLTLPVFATDRLVPSQYSTIQSAIDSAIAGDTVIISSGTYSGSSNSNLRISSSNKPLVIRSSEPTNPDVVANTVIDCSYTGYAPAFTIENGASVIIDGLTILDGYYNQGGGIIFRNSFASVRNCVFEDCIAWNSGGTIYAENSIIQLSNCVFRDSYSDLYGGTISSSNSRIEMLNCIIEGSFARSEGGAMYCNNNSDIFLDGCMYFDNWSQRNGGALYLYNSKLSVKGCDFSSNTALGRGIYMGGAVYIENSSVNGNIVIVDSNFSDNFSSGSGGAICSKKNSLDIKRSYFIGNTSQQTGGGISYDSNIVLTSSVLAGNSANEGSAIYCASKSQNTFIRNCTFADNLYTCMPTIRICGDNIEIINSVFSTSTRQFFYLSSRNLTFNYNDVQDGQFPTKMGIGNVQVNPMFVKQGSWNGSSYVQGDYHIKLESPIINAGDPNITLTNETDIDGNSRQRLGRVDIGAYEAGSHPMDFDQNGIVNFADINKIAEVWLWEAQWHK